MSDDPHYTKIHGLDSFVETPDTDARIESEGRTLAENETMIDDNVDEGYPSKSGHSGVSFNLTDSSGAYVCNSEQAFETEVVDYIESTEVEAPRLSCESPVKAYLDHDTGLTPNEVETEQTLPYINDCLNSTREQSHDIKFSSASHDSPTDVSLAFELVNGVMYTPGPPPSSTSGYVCNSSESTPLPESLESTPSSELLTTLPSPEMYIATGPPELVSGPEQGEQNTTPYVTSELLQSHHYPLSKDWKYSCDNSASTSSGYLSEDYMKSHFTPSNAIALRQSSPHSYKIQDLGGGYVDLSSDVTL